MQKWLISWILPFVIAILIVVLFKIFFVKFHYVANNAMVSSIKKGDRIICLNSDIENRGDVVLIKRAVSNSSSFKRIIGMPNDTVFARHSIVYINGTRFKEPTVVSHTYFFSSDNVQKASDWLVKNQIGFDSTLALIGVFQFSASLDELLKIKQDTLLFEVKRLICEPAVSVDKIKQLNPRLYWNKDNFGPIKVPAKGVSLKMTLNHYYLYKPVIERESGKSLEIIGNQVYLAKSLIEFYEFKQNYYFVLNDNRQDIDDSRSQGFIPEDDILSEFWFKLPW